MAKHQGSIIAPEHIRAGITDLVRRIGEAAAIAQLGIGKPALARLAAGLPVRRATADVAAMRLAGSPLARTSEP